MDLDTYLYFLDELPTILSTKSTQICHTIYLHACFKFSPQFIRKLISRGIINCGAQQLYRETATLFIIQKPR